ncbi:hypothetical protein BSSC8_36220 [Bacillus subtilis subsp. subtilis str. SC-8]|nr:hypothetical protein BSSC8_36220 [Bacillus subtilis subsp. subtilis str. SC-8]
MTSIMDSSSFKTADRVAPEYWLVPPVDKIILLPASYP